MAFIPVENTVQIELRFTMHGQQVENTLYFFNEDGVTLADLIALTGLVNDWYTAYLQGTQGSSVVLLEVYATDLTTATSPTYSNTALNGQVGGFTTGPIMPGNVTLTVSFRTAGRGRSSRGRNYVIGLPEASVVGNTVDTGLVNLIEAAYNAILTEIGFPWRWVVVSRQVDGAPRTEGLVQQVTNAIIVDPYVDSQRRRLTGRGT